MESSTPKTQGRTRIACEECRKNKRKCDGDKPICSLCKKSSKTCIYGSELSRKRKYVDEDLITRLEDQIKSLKYEVMQYRRIYAPKEFPGGSGLAAKTILDDVQPCEIDAPSNTNSLSPVSGFGEDQRPSDSVDIRSQVAMEDLASLMLTMDIQDRGEPSFMIPSTKMRPFEYNGSAIAQKGRQLDAVPKGRRSPNTDPQSILSRDLVHDFTTNFNIFHQFLDDDDPIYSSIEDPKNGDLDLQFRNHALFAAATHFSNAPESLELGSQFANFAESIVLRCMRETPNDLVAQGLTLLAWRELMLGNDSMAYNYIAMTTGLILHLGLHVSAHSRTAGTTDFDSNPGLRRRVRSFWAYFSVDRLITTSLGMNCTMHWQRVKSPNFLTILENPPSLDELAHEQFCQLWHLWDSCMDQVYAFGWSDLSSDERNRLVTRSHDALEDFYRQVDDRFKLRNTGNSVSAGNIWFNMAYHAAVLLVHRPFLNEPTGSFTLNFAMRCATSAAASITNIVRTYSKSHEFSIVAPQVIDYVMSASVIHLLNATSGKTALGRQSANGLKTCMDALIEMEPKWKSRAQLSIRKIQELGHKWEVVWALPLQVSQPLIQQQPDKVPDDWTSAEEYFIGTVGAQSYDSSQLTQDLLADDSILGTDIWDMDQYVSALAQVHVPPEFQENWNFDFLFDDRGNLVNL